MKKSPLIIVSLVILSTLGGIPTAINTEAPTGAVDAILIYGTIGLVVDLDPHFAWDSASIDHINQVAEGLFAYDLGSHEGGIIPRLAAGCGTWNENATEFTVPLRENVTFHDGTTFNATAVKWNFDRLTAFIEAGETQIAKVYEPLAGAYPATPLVINETIVVDTYEVKFLLNYPFAALVPLLCFSGSAMISPTSVPNSSVFLDIETDLLVGTGPFVHVNSTAEKTIFEAYSEYYRGTPAVQHMEWVFYEDTITTSNALLAGKIDLGDVNRDFLDEFEASPDITVGQLMKTPVIRYLRINNKIINKTIRQAVSYAIDYDHIIYNLLEGNAARMTSPVPEGIAYYHPEVQPATYDLIKARQILICANLSKGLTTDSTNQEWRDLANSDPIGKFDFLYNYGNIFRENLAVLVKSNLRDIGITVLIGGNDGWYPFYVWEIMMRNSTIAFEGWRADYNDPLEYINPLFSNTSTSNLAQVNDSWLQTAMIEAMDDTNPVTRKAKYFAIQEYIVEDLMPWVFLYVPISKNVLANTITNWTRNPMGQLDFFSITFHGEDATITDSQMGMNCGFEAPWDYYVPPERTDTTYPGESPICIPSYSLVALLSISALTILSTMYSRFKEKGSFIK
ncbi:MAG: ABC transporter substrate-binding protein [Promethearchaeota archaeon]